MPAPYRILQRLRQGPLTPIKLVTPLRAMIPLAKSGKRLAVACPHCGNIKWAWYTAAKVAQSCGCKTKEILRNSKVRHGYARVYGKETKTYRTWISMMQHCYQKNSTGYKDYGGRGISVCERWHDFAMFLADMGERPEGKTIGRINNNKGYSPSNCRWETPKEQARNRRSTVFLTINGSQYTMGEAAELLGMAQSSLWSRIKKWGLKEAIERPVKKQKNSKYPANSQ